VMAKYGLQRGVRGSEARHTTTTQYYRELKKMNNVLEMESKRLQEQKAEAEQELKQVKAEIRTDKLKSVATDAATALASGVSSLFGSGKMKSLERKNEDLRDEIAIRDETIEQLQSNIKQMEVEHQKQIQEVKQSYEAENRKQSEYIDRILRYFPYVEKLMPMIKYLSERMGFNDDLIRKLCAFKEIAVAGKLYSTMFNQSFSTDGAVCSLNEDKEGRFDLRIDGVSHHSWFRRKKDEFMEALGLPTSRRQNRGLKL
ncbi:MAG: mobilization protein, partial [Alistipes sp.]|nr:mobilization protein [Alistipes sp.]